MKGAGPQILGTGAKFKRVPCQKSCRVNRAKVEGKTLILTAITENNILNFVCNFRVFKRKHENIQRQTRLPVTCILWTHIYNNYCY